MPNLFDDFNLAVKERPQQKAEVNVFSDFQLPVHERPPYGYTTGQELDLEGLAYAKKPKKISFIKDLGLPEIGKAVKEMVSPTTEYTREESEAMGRELYDRLSWWKTYLFSLGGRVGPENLRKELFEQASEFKGFGPALMPAAGETGSLALEWGVLYPKLFETYGIAGKEISKLPRFKAGADALKRIGGLNKLIEKYPRTANVIQQFSKSVGKGGAVGGTIAGIETIGKEMKPGEIVGHIGKNAAIIAGVAGAFSLASEVDTRIWINKFRNSILNNHRARFDKRLFQIDMMPSGSAKTSATKSLGIHKTNELRAIDDIVSSAEAQLRGMKAAKLYKEGQELIENPISAAQRLSRHGLEKVKIYPKGPAGLKKGMGKARPFIEMPTTRAGEVLETAKEVAEAVRHPVKAFRKATIPTKPPTRPPIEIPEGIPISTKLEESRRRAEAKIRRKITQVSAGEKEGPLISRLYTQAEELIEKARTETDQNKRNAMLDEMEQIDNFIGQLDRTNLEGKSFSNLQKMAKRFGVEFPKGAEKPEIIDLLAGRADLSQIQKTDTGYKVKVPIAEMKAGRGWEVREFDSFAEAVDFLEGREEGAAAAVERPKPPTKPTAPVEPEIEEVPLTEPIPAPQPPAEAITKPEAVITPAEEVTTEKAFEIYQKFMPNATEEELVKALLADDLPLSDEMLEKYSDLPEAQERIEQQDIDRIIAERAKERKIISPAKAKQPWDMTREEAKNYAAFQILGKETKYKKLMQERDEYANQITKGKRFTKGGLADIPKEYDFQIRDLFFRSENFTSEELSKYHKLDKKVQDYLETLKSYGVKREQAVQQALEQGKPVPREVLEEYKSEKWAKEALKLPEPTIAPIEEQTIAGERWDSAKLGVKIEWIMRVGWRTKAGKLTKAGERFAESKWSELSDAAHNVITKEIKKDYPIRFKKAPPAVEEKITPITEPEMRVEKAEVAEEALEKAELEVVKGEYSIGDEVFISKKPSTAHLESVAGKVGKIIDIQILRGKPTSWAVDVEGEEYIIDTPKDMTKGALYEPAKEEAITEPKPSIEEQQRQARPTVRLEPTGKLDPTKPEDAQKIIQLQREFMRKEGAIAHTGIYETKWDEDKGENVISKVIYSHKQVDQAYRTLQTEVESPQEDVSLFAMPGKEKELGAIGKKMAKMKALSEKKRQPSIGKARQLPKAKTKKEDFIKAILKATTKEESRYAINGIYVEGKNLLATDSRRLFIAKGNWGKGGLYLDRSSLSKGILGKADKSGKKFPSWKDIVPDYSKEKAITISPTAVNNDLPTVWRRLHQAASMTTEESKGVIVILNKDGSLGFTASAPEVGHTEINVNPGGKMLGAINPGFLIDALAFHAVRGDRLINFYFPYPDSPMITIGPHGETKTLTMPINIGEPSKELKEAIAEEKAKPTKPKGAAAGASVAAAAEAGGGYGTIASSEKNLFAEKTNRRRFRDSAPGSNGIKAVDELLKVVSPASRAGKARAGSRVLRKNLGRLAQETEVAHNALRKAHHAFTFMSKKDVYEFIDRMENGQNQGTLKLNQIAKSLRDMLDGRRDDVQDLGKGHLENFYENYFPHIWKDPSAAKKVINKIFGKRRLEGSKAFLKKRTIMTIKEGRSYGLELVSENPVDLVLLKVYEMDRYIMAQRIIQELKGRGLIKFVYSRSKSPDGYVKVNDNAFTVYMPPEITKKEAYDQLLVDQLMDIARSLGIDTQRFVSLGKGRGRWWGFARKEPEKVRTRYAGPESVLAHEIGHVLGFRYHLYEVLGRRKEGEYKTITKGKMKGEKRFVHAKEAVEHRRTIDREWRDLADLRRGAKSYVRKAAEKEAVLVEAIIHAPDEFKRVAPKLYDLFTNFLNSHSELRPLLDLKPSLVLGTSDAKIEIPGFTVLGHYYAPEPVAKLLNNYLSPGLRNNENQLIAGGYNLIRMAGNLLNQAQLSLSGFHGINVTTDMIASTIGQGLRQLNIKGQRIKGIGKIIISPTAPISRIWMGVRLRRAYKQQIESIENPRMRNLVRAVVLANGRDRMDPFYYNQAIKALTQTLGDIVRGSPAQKISGVFKLPFQTFGATLEALAKPLMEWYVPTGKLGLFAMIAESEMARAEAGQITDEQLHEQLIRSWDSVDNRMGQLVYDNLFWNKYFRDVSMMAVRSVGWNLGSWREYGGVPIDILGTKGRIERGDVWLSQKMAYTIGAITFYAILGSVAGYLLTGKRPEELKDYFFPKTGKKNPDGSDERLSFPTYAKDWFAYKTQPYQTVKNKLHPIWSLLTDVVSNKDFFNTEIHRPDDPIGQQFYDTIEYIGKESLPISVKNYQKMTKAAPGQIQRNAWVSITGITSAPSYITRSPAQKLMYRYIIENIPDKPKTKEKAELYEYRRNIKNRLRKGDPVDQEEAKKRMGRTSWLKLKKEAEKEPFAESFGRLSLEQVLNVYAIASQKERELVLPILKRKWKSARERTDEMKQMYENLLKGAD